LLMLFGILGYVLRRFHYPIAPVVVGLILGPMAEKSLRQALQISQGNPMALFHSWIAVILWILALTAVLLPLYLRYRGPKVMEQLGSGDTD
jgi:putative tricarboxylic transport membrane protein